MSLIDLKHRWLTSVIVSILLLVLTGCGGSNTQAAIVGKWQLVGLTFNGNSTSIPTDQINLQVQFYKENAVSINFIASDASVGGDGTYKFVDDNNIRIEMPQGSQGLLALKTFVATMLTPKVRPVFSAANPSPTPEGFNPTPIPTDAPPPILDTDPNSGIYEVQVSGDQLTMKGKDGVTITYKKVN